MQTTISGIARADYDRTRAWGLSTAFCAYGCDGDAIRSRDHIVEFTHRLCDLLHVKRFGDTQVVRFGADPRVQGYSMVQLIETSLVSAHFAEESNAVYLDVFSCRWYDAETAAAFTKEFFAAERVEVQACLRP